LREFGKRCTSIISTANKKLYMSNCGFFNFFNFSEHFFHNQSSIMFLEGLGVYGKRGLNASNLWTHGHSYVAHL
ncbi:MAG: hypothetical protein Q3982_07965, partial [Phoenicibacter congonensis]|nr:hypothetical protein [Phoenicibacter congonensis]